MTRIGQLFRRTHSQGRSALIAYLTAGDPNPGRTVGLVRALQRGGADLIELGVPFSDPIADGPVIQRAADRALRAGITMRKVLDIAKAIRSESDIPLVLFTYLNPALRYGFDKLGSDAAAAGIDGCLLTDLSVEEAEHYGDVTRTNGLDTVFLAAPTSTDRRLELVAKYSSGFVYLVSRTGVTGEQSTVGTAAAELVRRMRCFTSLPLAVGFGISTPEQVASVGAIADGVVVGSALVRTIERYGAEPTLEEEVEQFTRGLAGGLARKAAQ
ncbi:MAG: tryptophan synthase subunit alpha [Bryobacteraceae bacterium]|nr:tryptophan synthase subunit alpha [Bryobacteraceae bacterium]